jgi:phospholipid transport system substrate-binding protein
MIKQVWLCLTMAALLLCGLEAVPALAQTAGAGAAGPRDTITRTIDQLVAIVEANPGDQNQEQRRKKMREAITPRFDFQEMAQLSLGPQWAKITPEERTEFVNIFSELLAKTYLNRIGSIQRGMVKKLKEPKALVRTTVDYKGDVFPLDYKLINRDGSWKVYDVIIENIGLVVNYRNEFAGIIRKEQFSGLMQRLRDKL